MRVVQSFVTGESAAHVMTNSESARLARSLGVGQVDLQAMINEAGRKLGSLRYADADHTPVFYRSGHNWQLKAIAGRKLPDVVVTVLREKAAFLRGA